jgi:hypothetical protein
LASRKDFVFYQVNCLCFLQILSSFDYLKIDPLLNQLSVYVKIF